MSDATLSRFVGLLPRVGACALAVLVALVGGATAVFLETPYAPLLVAALFPGVALLFRPVAALYIVFFIKFLPHGIIDGDLQSALANLALLVAVGAWLIAAVGERRLVRVPLALTLLCAVALLHYVSLIWAPDPYLARSEMVQWVLMLFMVVTALNVIQTPAALTGFMAVIAASGWVLVLSGLYTVAAGGYAAGDRLQVFEANPNGYGIALIASLAGVIYLAITPGRYRALAVALSFAYIPLAGLLIVFTGSRGGLLSLAQILAVFLLFRPTRPWGLVALVLSLVAVLAMPDLFASITNRLIDPAESQSGDRDLLWRASGDLIADHPWGVGVGYGPTALYDYILRYTPNYATRPRLPSHNPILEIGIDTGLLGILFYSATLIVAIWSFRRAYRQAVTAGSTALLPYFVVVGAVLAGYATSWIKSGGVYFDDMFGRQLTLLLIPTAAPFFASATRRLREPGQERAAPIPAGRAAAGQPEPTPIAIVIGQLGQGGSERQLYAFLANCDRAAWRPLVFVSGELGHWAQPIRDLGIPVTLLTGNVLRKLWQFRAACDAARVRHVFSWSSYTNAYALMLVGLGGRRVGSFRNRLFADLPERRRRLWAWLSLAGIDTVVCNSRVTFKAMQRLVGRRKTVVFAPNSVEPPADIAASRAAWRARLGVADDEVLVVGVGRLTPQKNFGRFIETIALARAEAPVRAVIAGDDLGCRAALEAQAEAAGLAPDALRLLGPVPDGRELLCAADIFLLTSDHEGTPNVLLEAMAAGVPSVCTTTSNAAELMADGVEGSVVAPRAELLAAAVCALANDQSLRARVGAAATRVAWQYWPQPIAERLWELCREERRSFLQPGK